MADSSDTTVASPSPSRRGFMTLTAACAAAGAAPFVDLRLCALADELDAIDKRIRQLLRKYPDLDCDETPGYLQLEERRWGVLQELAETSAGSIDGMKAKARALKTREVAEDFETTCAIADSLANDLLAARS